MATPDRRTTDSAERTEQASVESVQTVVRHGGRAFVYGDDVDTDRLFPGRYLFVADPDGMRKYALEDLDPTFRDRVRDGDVIVGGRNFGCGSSREQAVACLRHSGVRTVIARSFARIYYRNAINNGVAPLVCPEAVDGIRDGDDLAIDVAAGTITNATRRQTYRFEPLPDFLRAILDDGGLVPHLRKRFAPSPPQMATMTQLGADAP